MPSTPIPSGDAMCADAASKSNCASNRQFRMLNRTDQKQEHADIDISDKVSNPEHRDPFRYPDHFDFFVK